MRDYLKLNELEFRGLFRDSPIKRIKRRGLLRNVCVALGNVGDAHDPAVRNCVERYLAVDDAMLRVHAVWAAHRLGLDELLPIDDPDAIVVEELAASR